MIKDIKKVKVSVKALADIYGVTPPTAYAWIKAEIFKQGADGQVLFADAVRALYKYQKKLIMGKGSDDLISQRARIAKADAELKELSLAKIRGELLPADDAREQIFNLARQTRDAIVNIPSRVAAILAAEKNEHTVRELLKAELRQALERLSA